MRYLAYFVIGCAALAVLLLCISFVGYTPSSGDYQIALVTIIITAGALFFNKYYKRNK